MIFKRAFEAKFEQLSQTKEEVVLRTYEICILGVVLSTNMVTQVQINSSLKTMWPTWRDKGSYFLDDFLVLLA